MAHKLKKESCWRKKCNILPPNISIGKIKEYMYMFNDCLKVKAKIGFMIMFFYSLLLSLNSSFAIDKIIFGGILS